MPLVNFLIENSNNYSNKEAIFDQKEQRSISYSELLDESYKWASWLENKGVAKGDRVAILATNRLEHILLLFACSLLNASLVPLNFRLSKNEIDELIDITNPKVFLTEFEPCERSTNFKDIKFPKPHSNFTPLENKSLLILFTSGTTGTPKGVMLSDLMIETNIKYTCECWNLNSDDIAIIETPFFHTGGYNVFCLPLLKLGGKVILAEKFDAKNAIQSIFDHKITVYFGVPTMFQLIADNELFTKKSLESIRFFISGGAPISLSLIENYQKLGLNFKQGFGLTEVGPNCFLLNERDSIRKIGSIGKPMPHSDVIVLNENNRPVKVEETGELLIKGDHVCSGYYGRPDLFEEVMFEGYFRTGDLVKYDNEGDYYIVSRKKDMYISGGENVYPAEVEKQLSTHQDIDDSVVVSVPNEKWGEVGLAFLKTKRHFEVSEIKDFLNKKLSRYKMPMYIENRNEFPILPNGKVNRKLLKEEARNLI